MAREIHESVLSMLALANEGLQVRAMALPGPQARVMNHSKVQEMQEHRDMLIEAARIARGKIEDLRKVQPHELDALVIPGGFGVALNLCTFAKDGAAMKVNADVAALVRSCHEAGRPIGAICIAPVVVAKVLGSYGVTVTSGNSPDVAKAMESWGARHEICAKDTCIVDRQNRVITTPAYMYDDSTVPEVYAGIQALARELKGMLS